MSSNPCRELALVPYAEQLDECNPAPVMVFSSAPVASSIGSSFVKMFQGAYAHVCFLPKGYTVSATASGQCWLTPRPASGRTYRVLLEHLSDRQALTEGWNDLVVGEKIDNGDVGYFNRTGELEFSIVIHNMRGVQKPTSEQPPADHPRWRDTAWCDVKYELSGRTYHSNQLAETLYAVWSSMQNPRTSFGITMKANNVMRNVMVFTKKFSETVPIGEHDVPVALLFNGSGTVVHGSMAKGTDRILRITGGWLDFVRAHRIGIDMTYVLRFGQCPHGWQLTVFQA